MNLNLHFHFYLLGFSYEVICNSFDSFFICGNCSDTQRTTFSENENEHGPGTDAPAENDAASAVKFKVETVAANLEVPWDLLFCRTEIFFLPSGEEFD